MTINWRNTYKTSEIRKETERLLHLLFFGEILIGIPVLGRTPFSKGSFIHEAFLVYFNTYKRVSNIQKFARWIVLERLPRWERESARVQQHIDRLTDLCPLFSGPEIAENLARYLRGCLPHTLELSTSASQRETQGHPFHLSPVKVVQTWNVLHRDDQDTFVSPKGEKEDEWASPPPFSGLIHVYDRFPHALMALVILASRRDNPDAAYNTIPPSHDRTVFHPNPERFISAKDVRSTFADVFLWATQPNNLWRLFDMQPFKENKGVFDFIDLKGFRTLHGIARQILNTKGPMGRPIINVRRPGEKRHPTLLWRGVALRRLLGRI